ncbi:hypothetical protein J6590_010652 [Homalodisca vitripennis]|nr:hypothetical protein J6590_010652 [Homalodisca vitripennis]
MARGKRYTVHEYNDEEEQPQSDDYMTDEEREEEANFENKDEAEIEKITEEGYGKDYEDGNWDNPDEAPPNESVPEDYDSADYEDKRAEEVSGSAEYSGSAEQSEEEDYSESEEPSVHEFNGSGARLSVGSITGERMLLDEDGFPIFENHEFDDFDLRRWSKRDTKLAKGPDYSYDYNTYQERESRTTVSTPVLTTSIAPETTSINSTVPTNVTQPTEPTNSTVPTEIEKEESAT